MKTRNKIGFLLAFFCMTVLLTVASCKTQDVAFVVQKLSICGKNALNRDAISLTGEEEVKNIEIEVSNCQDFTLSYSIKEKNGSGVASSGRVVVEIDEFPDGNNELTIMLKGKGMRTFTKKLKIGVGLDKTNAKVFLKLGEDSLAQIVNEGECFTKKDSETVVIQSEVEMAKVLVNATAVTLSADKKSAEVSVEVGNVEINIEYAEHSEISLKFTLRKLPENEMLPLMLSSATVYSGDDYDQKDDIEFAKINEKKENEMKEAIELANIQYSVVKLVMKFDAPLTKAEFVRFSDSRSGAYVSDPISSDLNGVFSGRIVKEIDATGKETELVNIAGNTYTEYLVVGAGIVEYTIKFSAEGRKEQTYKVKINNMMEKKFSAGDEEHPGRVQEHMNSITYCGLGGQNNLFRWVGYIPQPWNFIDPPYSDQNEWYRGMQQPEYMGDHVAMVLRTNADIQGKLYFCYTISNLLIADRCHEWVRMEGTEADGWKKVSFCIDPKESYMDAFVGVKDSLPWLLMPVSTDKKWKKIIKKGFILKIARSEEVTKMRRGRRPGDSTKENPKPGLLDSYPKAADRVFEELFNYRIQAKTYEKNNIKGKEHKTPLVIAMQQNWEQNNDMQLVEFEPQAYLLTGETTNSKRDIFALVPTFSGNMSESVKSCKYTITKEGSTDSKDTKEYTYSNVDGMKAFVIGGESGCEYTQRDGDTPPSVTGHDKIFMFEKGESGKENVYKIAVEVELKDGDKEYFDFVIDYKNRHTVKQIDVEKK